MYRFCLCKGNDIHFDLFSYHALIIHMQRINRVGESAKWSYSEQAPWGMGYLWINLLLNFVL